MAQNDLGPSFADFLVDLVGGDSNVKMQGLAQAQGFDTSNTKTLLEQIAAAVKKSQDAGPQDIAGIENPSLADASRVAQHHKNHLQLLNSLNDFYTKKFAPQTK